MFQRKPRHQHDWKLIDKEHIEGMELEQQDGFKARGGNQEAILRTYYREVGYLAQGYYSYVFKCECGEVMVKRS